MAERYRGRDLLRAAGLSGAFLGRPRQGARRHPVHAALIALGLALVVVVTQWRSRLFLPGAGGEGWIAHRQ